MWHCVWEEGHALACLTGQALGEGAHRFGVGRPKGTVWPCETGSGALWLRVTATVRQGFVRPAMVRCRADPEGRPNIRRDANMNERSRGCSELHGHGTFSASKAGGWRQLAVGGW